MCGGDVTFFSDIDTTQSLGCGMNVLGEILCAVVEGMGCMCTCLEECKEVWGNPLSSDIILGVSLEIRGMIVVGLLYRHKYLPSTLIMNSAH